MNIKLDDRYEAILNHLYNYPASKDGFYSYSSTALGIAEAIGARKSATYKWLNYLSAAGFLEDELARVRNLPLIKGGKTRRKTKWRCYYLSDEAREAVESGCRIWSESLQERPMVQGTVEA